MQTNKFPLQSYKTGLNIFTNPGLGKPCFEKPGPVKWHLSIYPSFRAYEVFSASMLFGLDLPQKMCL